MPRVLAMDQRDVGVKKMLGRVQRERSAMTEQRKTLPKRLPGAVCQQYVRCGRLTCPCAAGALHGPYFYRFWREHGRLRKAYVRTGDVVQVRAACVAERQARGYVRALRDGGYRFWRDLEALIREYERA